MKTEDIKEEEDVEIEFDDKDFEGMNDLWNELSGIEVEHDDEDDTDDEEDDSEDDTQSEEEESEDSEEESEEEEPEEESEEESEDNSEKASDEHAEDSEQEESSEEEFQLMHPTKGGKYNRKDTLALAQKGLDYDFIRNDRDTLRKENEELKRYKDFVEDVAKHTGTKDADEQMLRTRATWKISEASKKGEEISETDAILAVQEEMRQASKNTEPAPKSDKPEQPEVVDRNRSMIDTFIKDFPDVEAKDIPQSVYDEAGKTGDLSGAYRKFLDSELKSENAKLKDEIKRLKLNEKNKKRSTGTRKTSGKKSNTDDIVDYWNSL